jgi:hypothetical protein
MVNTNTNTNIKTQPTSEVSLTASSVNVSVDNSIQAGCSAEVNNSNASIEVGANVKTGTIASAGAGLDGKNVYLDVSYSDTTEAHLTIDSKVDYHGVGGSGSIYAYAKSGTELEMACKVGANGANVSAGASTGTYVGVDAEGTMQMRGVSTSVGGGVTVGDHFEIGGGGKATYEKGKIELGVSGDVAALVGAEVDLGVTIDTKQIQKDAVKVGKETEKVCNTISKGGKKQEMI